MDVYKQYSIVGIFYCIVRLEAGTSRGLRKYLSIKSMVFVSNHHRYIFVWFTFEKNNLSGRSVVGPLGSASGPLDLFSRLIVDLGSLGILC